MAVPLIYFAVQLGLSYCISLATEWGTKKILDNTTDLNDTTKNWIATGVGILAGITTGGIVNKAATTAVRGSVSGLSSKTLIEKTTKLESVIAKKGKLSGWNQMRYDAFQEAYAGKKYTSLNNRANAVFNRLKTDQGVIAQHRLNKLSTPAETQRATNLLNKKYTRAMNDQAKFNRLTQQEQTELQDALRTRIENYNRLRADSQLQIDPKAAVIGSPEYVNASNNGTFRSLTNKTVNDVTTNVSSDSRLLLQRTRGTASRFGNPSDHDIKELIKDPALANNANANAYNAFTNKANQAMQVSSNLTKSLGESLKGKFSAHMPFAMGQYLSAQTLGLFNGDESPGIEDEDHNGKRIDIRGGVGESDSDVNDEGPSGGGSEYETEMEISEKGQSPYIDLYGNMLKNIPDYYSNEGIDYGVVDGLISSIGNTIVENAVLQTNLAYAMSAGHAGATQAYAEAAKTGTGLQANLERMVNLRLASENGNNQATILLREEMGEGKMRESYLTFLNHAILNIINGAKTANDRMEYLQALVDSANEATTTKYGKTIDDDIKITDNKRKNLDSRLRSAKELYNMASEQNNNKLAQQAVEEVMRITDELNNLGSKSVDEITDLLQSGDFNSVLKGLDEIINKKDDLSVKSVTVKNSNNAAGKIKQQLRIIANNPDKAVFEDLILPLGVGQKSYGTKRDTNTTPSSTTTSNAPANNNTKYVDDDIDKMFQVRQVAVNGETKEAYDIKAQAGKRLLSNVNSMEQSRPGELNRDRNKVDNVKNISLGLEGKSFKHNARGFNYSSKAKDLFREEITQINARINGDTNASLVYENGLIPERVKDVVDQLKSYKNLNTNHPVIQFVKNNYEEIRKTAIALDVPINYAATLFIIEDAGRYDSFNHVGAAGHGQITHIGSNSVKSFLKDNNLPKVIDNHAYYVANPFIGTRDAMIHMHQKFSYNYTKFGNEKNKNLTRLVAYNGGVPSQRPYNITGNGDIDISSSQFIAREKARILGKYNNLSAASISNLSGDELEKYKEQKEKYRKFINNAHENNRYVNYKLVLWDKLDQLFPDELSWRNFLASNTGR